jgi:L-asparagine transporter-like permease
MATLIRTWQIYFGLIVILIVSWNLTSCTMEDISTKDFFEFGVEIITAIIVSIWAIISFVNNRMRVNEKDKNEAFRQNIREEIEALKEIQEKKLSNLAVHTKTN